KSGKSGPLTFVTVAHEISADGVLAIEEEQTIVYRDAGAQAPAQRSEARAADWRMEVTPDAVLLFRYSALTFNGHRIRYDRPYATQNEGYPGLVVHGPLQATLMAGLARRELGAPLKQFSFRGVSPAFEGAPLVVSGARSVDGAEVWVEQDGV